MQTRSLIAVLAISVLLTACVGTFYVTRENIRSLEQGMTEQQVVRKIGQPMEVNRTRTAGTGWAQFVYARGPYDYAYVYFEDYRLTSVQY